MYVQGMYNADYMHWASSGPLTSLFVPSRGFGHTVRIHSIMLPLLIPDIYVQYLALTVSAVLCSQLGVSGCK
jgi:hypothetical protein